MKCDVEMDSGGMIYITSFINICSHIQKLMGRHTYMHTHKVLS
jgi:hypothetical protein